MIAIGGSPVWAADDPATAQVKTILARIDEAASRCDVDGVVSQYAPRFRSADGLDLAATRRALSNLCTRIDRPVYRTEVRSVKQLARGRLAVTATTNLTADYRTELAKPAQLIGTIETLNRFEEQGGTLRVVGQEVLSEQTTISIGEKPPRVNLNLPSVIRPGKEFRVEAVLPTPLQDAPALGGISLTPISAAGAGTPPKAPTLEPLRSGGIFKVGQAPEKPQDQTLTLAFVRDGGLLIVSQRLKVASDPPEPRPSAKDLLPKE
jgi:hypothetical protein